MPSAQEPFPPAVAAVGRSSLGKPQLQPPRLTQRLLSAGVAGRPESRSDVVSPLQKSPYKSPTHIAQQQEPWRRLSVIPTFTSTRRETYLFDPKIPKDDLDFRLSALYNHHNGLFKNKTEVLFHKESSQDTKGVKSQFPGQCVPLPPPPSTTSLGNIRHWINPQKESIHSIQGSIVSPHTAATNGGYSRKSDGGFFST
ncbi:protein CFAP276 [Perognathus longimembris pacificus]|uniref:protein CFAP276 n=1 Tax=Perognathus longimembris pacificus TaxID=214514 RepID=UPI0020186541|nr:protein CFAP276 [Perognathus longimembris pacificus]